MAQDPALVLHPVLHADDRRRGRRHAQLGERVVGVLALHGQQHDGIPVRVAGPRHLRRLGDDRDGQGDGLVGALEDEARLEGAAMVAPGHQGDVVALLEQAGPDGAPDGTGPHDDEAHGVHSATCQALSVASLNPVERAAALGGTVAGGPAAPGRRPGRAVPGRHGAHRAACRRDQGASRRRSPPTPTRPTCRPTAWRGWCTPTCPPCSSAVSARSCCRRCTRWPWRAWPSTRATERTRWAGCGGRPAFVATTTFGTVAEAEAAIAQVQRVHRRVKGIAPDGRAYSADDPELVTFIHVAEVSSFLASSQRYGPRPLTPEQCDRYYEEVAPVALALGATWAPRSSDEVESYLLRVRPELYAGPQAKAARDWLLRGVARRPSERAVYSLVLAAAVGVLPGWARRELGLVPRRPARPVRRHRGRDPAHPRAHRRPALDGDPAGLRTLRWRWRSRRRRPRPGP